MDNYFDIIINPIIENIFEGSDKLENISLLEKLTLNADSNLLNCCCPICFDEITTRGMKIACPDTFVNICCYSCLVNECKVIRSNNGIPYKRIHSFLKSELDLNRLSISSRIQYQTKFRGKLDFSNQIKKYWRKKFEFSYNFKNWKLDPKLGCEFFMKNNFLMPKNYKKYRIFFGTRFSGREFGKIDVKYLLEKGVKSASSNPVHVMKIGYIIN